MFCNIFYVRIRRNGNISTSGPRICCQLSPLSSAMSISYKGIEILTISQHLGRFWHAQKRLFVYFLSKCWHRHWIQRPWFPVTEGNFGDPYVIFSVIIFIVQPQIPPYFIPGVTKWLRNFVSCYTLHHDYFHQIWYAHPFPSYDVLLSICYVTLYFDLWTFGLKRSCIKRPVINSVPILRDDCTLLELWWTLCQHYFQHEVRLLHMCCITWSVSKRSDGGYDDDLL